MDQRKVETGVYGRRSGESTRLSPMWLGFDCQVWRHMWLEFVGSLLCTERLDCEQSLFGQSRLSSAGLEIANSRERGKHECEASESRGKAREKAGKEGETAFSFEPDVFR